MSPDRAPFEPEDVMRIVRQVGFGLLVGSLFVDWGAQRYFRWRRGVSNLQYRILPAVGNPGASLADLGLEMLDATSSRSRA